MGGALRAAAPACRVEQGGAVKGGGGKAPRKTLEIQLQAAASFGCPPSLYAAVTHRKRLLPALQLYSPPSKRPSSVAQLQPTRYCPLVARHESHVPLTAVVKSDRMPLTWLTHTGDAPL